MIVTRADLTGEAGSLSVILGHGATDLNSPNFRTRLEDVPSDVARIFRDQLVMQRLRVMVVDQQELFARL